MASASVHGARLSNRFGIPQYARACDAKQKRLSCRHVEKLYGEQVPTTKALTAAHKISQLSELTRSLVKVVMAHAYVLQWRLCRNAANTAMFNCPFVRCF